MTDNTALRKHRKKNIWPYLFLAPFILVYLAFFAFPIGYSFYISLHDWTITSHSFEGLKNYVKLFTSDPYFIKSIKNTLIIMLFTIPILIILGLLLANKLADEKLKHRQFFRTANYLPYITTPVAVAIIFSMMFDRNVGVVNEILVKTGIFKEPINWLTAAPAMQRIMLVFMLVWEWVGYYTIVYIASITGLPMDVYEAAKVDGASGFKIFFKITVPLLKNITMFLVITSIITQLQLFDQPYLLVRGMGTEPTYTLQRPLMTVMTNFMDQSIQNGRLGYGAAITYGLFLVICIITFGFLMITRRRGKADD